MVMRKLQLPPVPGTIPVLLNISVQMPAAEVPKAVLTMAVAITIPSPGFEILPQNKLICHLAGGLKGILLKQNEFIELRNVP